MESEESWMTVSLVKGRLMSIDRKNEIFTREVVRKYWDKGEERSYAASYSHGIAKDFSDEDYEELAECIGLTLVFKLKDGKLVSYEEIGEEDVIEE